WYTNYNTQRPGKQIFAKYIAWRTRFPNQDFYLIHPKSLWNAWDVVEYFNTGKPIRKIVPSSGFTGITMMLGMCDTVSIYGFANKLNNQCHYHYEKNCPTFRWHPISEKQLIRSLHEGSEDDLQRDVLT
uniref:beta-galactoside alpha-(2,6)-sialyltransferase n=1 Tax=Saccoglossus kowalevskii TaxID=10224 RepID=A0ABM0MBB7_SACKO